MSFDAIGIACKDPKQTINFYECFGISFEASGEDHFEGTTSSGVRLMLDSYELMKKINPSWKEPLQSGITLCFLQNSPSEVDLLYKKIVDRGYKGIKEPWDAFWGQRYATVVDPDGNQVDIFAALATK